MSQDEFADYWDNLSPNQQDLLFQKVASVESAAATHQVDHQKAPLTSEQKENYPKKNGAFQVYHDEPSTPPPTLTRKANVLGEASLNKQPRDTQTDDKKKNKEKPVARALKAITPVDRPGTGPLVRDVAVPPKVLPQRQEIINDNCGDDEEDMWIEFDVDFASIVKDIECGKDSAGIPTLLQESQKLEAGPEKQFVAPGGDQMHESCPDALLNQFGGFVKAGSKEKVQAGEAARKKAHAMFADDEPTELQKKSVSATGFTTAGGKAVNITSESAKRKAAQLLSQRDDPISGMSKEQQLCEQAPSSNKMTQNASEPPSELPGHETASSHPASCGEKRPTPDSPTHDFNYEDVLSRYGGFRTGNGQTGIAVSTEAKRQAIALLTSDSAKQEVKKPNSINSSKESNESERTCNQMAVVPQSRQSSNHLSRYHKQINQRTASVARCHFRPFKSPTVDANIGLTMAAVSKRTTPCAVRARGATVFNLAPAGPRQRLCDVGPLKMPKRSDLEAMGISQDIIDMTAAAARTYKFDTWGSVEAESDMIDAGAIPQYIPQAWVMNHYGWIVWNIACMVRFFPSQFQSWWSPTKVVEQLLYRYEREINQGHRSVLKKIIERDDIPAKHMILVIADIKEINTGASSLPEESGGFHRLHKYQLQLTDGWYRMPALIDEKMERAIASGLLKIGFKLSVTGAQIVGDRTARSPLSANEDSSLTITTNGCLPVRWHTKLGYHRKKLVIRPLSSLFEDGGMVTAVDVVVCRKYPMMYTETLSNGMTVTRTAREEEGLRQQSESSLYEQAMTGGLDRSNTQRDQRHHDRKVSGYFKVRICDQTYQGDPKDAPLATLLVSNANTINHMDVSEGGRYRLLFIMPYSPKLKRFPGMNFRTTRQTRWEPVTEKITVHPPAYVPRQITLCSDVRAAGQENDVDVAVLVLHSSPAMHEQSGADRKVWHQNLLVTDESKALCQIKLRLATGPLMGIDGQILGLMNLRYELYDGKFSISHLKATDESEIVMKHASTDYMQQAMRRARAWKQSQPQEVQEVQQCVTDIMQ